MRTFVIVGGLTLALTAAAEAQGRDSTYWTYGVGLGYIPSSLSPTSGNRSSGSLQVERRRTGSGVAYRAEISMARHDELFTKWDGVCGGCYNDRRLSRTSALVSAMREWRSDQMLRPYIIGGGGFSQGSSGTTSNAVHSNSQWILSESLQRKESDRLSATLAYGYGLSVNTGRFVGFAEMRGRIGALGPYDPFTFGFRILDQ